MSKKSKIHDPAIDALRLISILAVVLIHTTTRTLEISHYDLINHQFTLFLNQAARFAVPLFFLISGFVLTLSYTPGSYLTYLKKRLSKVLIPYVFWSFIYYFFIYKNHSDSFLKALLTGSASWQLYFIPSLLIFYLIFPVLFRFYRLLTTHLLISLLLFIAEVLILNYDYQRHNSSIAYPLEVFLFNYFVFLFGTFAAKQMPYIASKRSRILLVLIPPTIFMSYFVFHEGLTNYYKTWNYIYFYSQWRPSILIYTLLIFIFLYSILSRVIHNSSYIIQLSKLSFLVFFIHIIVLEALSKYLLNYNILFFISVTVISFLIAYLIHKSKFLSALTG